MFMEEDNFRTCFSSMINYPHSKPYLQQIKAQNYSLLQQCLISISSFFDSSKAQPYTKLLGLRFCKQLFLSADPFVINSLTEVLGGVAKIAKYRVGMQDQNRGKTYFINSSLAKSSGYPLQELQLLGTSVNIFALESIRAWAQWTNDQLAASSKFKKQYQDLIKQGATIGQGVYYKTIDRQQYIRNQMFLKSRNTVNYSHLQFHPQIQNIKNLKCTLSSQLNKPLNIIYLQLLSIKIYEFYNKIQYLQLLVTSSNQSQYQKGLKWKKMLYFQRWCEKYLTSFLLLKYEKITYEDLIKVMYDNEQKYNLDKFVPIDCSRQKMNISINPIDQSRTSLTSRYLLEAFNPRQISTNIVYQSRSSKNNKNTTQQSSRITLLPANTKQRSIIKLKPNNKTINTTPQNTTMMIGNVPHNNNQSNNILIEETQYYSIPNSTLSQPKQQIIPFSINNQRIISESIINHNYQQQLQYLRHELKHRNTRQLDLRQECQNLAELLNRYAKQKYNMIQQIDMLKTQLQIERSKQHSKITQNTRQLDGRIKMMTKKIKQLEQAILQKDEKLIETQSKLITASFQNKNIYLKSKEMQSQPLVISYQNANTILVDSKQLTHSRSQNNTISTLQQIQLIQRFKKSGLKNKQLLYKDSDFQVGFKTILIDNFTLKLILYYTNCTEKIISNLKTNIEIGDGFDVLEDVKAPAIVQGLQQERQQITIKLLNPLIAPSFILLKYLHSGQQQLLKLRLPLIITKFLSFSSQSSSPKSCITQTSFFLPQKTTISKLKAIFPSSSISPNKIITQSHYFPSNFYFTIQLFIQQDNQCIMRLYKDSLNKNQQIIIKQVCHCLKMLLQYTP